MNETTAKMDPIALGEAFFKGWKEGQDQSELNSLLDGLSPEEATQARDVAENLMAEWSPFA